MIKPIIKDTLFLAQKAQPATIDDLSVGKDLEDTLLAHKHECVGMAANMIGVNKCIIVFIDGKNIILMYNPEIIKVSGNQYETEEGCLSRPGKDPIKTKRYKKVKVSYLDKDFKKKIKTYEGFTAQIIQHEMDHLKGVLI